MRASIGYQPEKGDVYAFYLESGGCAFTRSAEGEVFAHPVKQGEEMPAFLQLSREEYLAIATAILERESPRLAEASLLREMLDRISGYSDRLLTLVEDATR